MRFAQPIFVFVVNILHGSRQDLDAYTMFGVELKPNHPRYE